MSCKGGKPNQSRPSASESLVLVGGGRVPGEPLLVELDDDLGTLHVGLPGGHQVSLVTSLPLDEEHQLPRAVCGSNYPLCLQSSVKTWRRRVLLRLSELGVKTTNLWAVHPPLGEASYWPADHLPHPAWSLT